MKRIGPLMLVLIALSASSVSAEAPGRIVIADDLYLEALSENVWMHVSTVDMPPWGPVSANGLVYAAGDGAVLIDTPWNDRQTRDLVEWLEADRGLRTEAVIVGHHHDDNLGGLGWIRGAGIPSYAIRETQDICRGKGLPMPSRTVGGRETLRFSGRPVQVFFPGEGHTSDSIAVYLPDEEILFGGCSVKALSARGPGNTAEANLAEWPRSLERLKEAFPGARIVVPGHGAPGDLGLIDHTIGLLR